ANGKVYVGTRGSLSVFGLSTQASVTLTVGKTGTGDGTVTSADGRIACGTSCSASYRGGTTVTLTATPSQGSVFAGWSGCDGVSGTTCTAMLGSGPKSVTATFNLQPGFTLTVSKGGTGSGTVTSSDGGISCGPTCAATAAAYASGTVVTLTASAGGGSTFGGWSGCDGVSGTTCAVTMSSARTVTATFNVQRQQFTLTVSTAGTGSGTVGSSDGLITCPGTCSATYPSGTSVTLTATPASGSTFAGWSSCTGTGPCTVTMSSARTVTATFNVQSQQFTLTVSTAGTGSGTVGSSDGLINCPGTCSATYPSGTSVTLTATPASGSTFAGWSGGCGATNTCTVTLAGNTTVAATFGTAGVSAPVLMWQYGGCLPGPSCDTGWYSSPAVADIDGDGLPDVVWGNYDVVALNGADGSLKWRATSSHRVWPSIAVAALTAGGPLEVIAARASDELTVYDGFGNTVWTRNPFGTGELRTLAVADLESDGRLEILVGRTGGDQSPQLTAFEPDGTVRPGWPVRHSGEPGFGWGLYNQNVVVADMNGDGFKEVFSPTTGHYITAVDRNGNQLPTNAVYNDFTPVGPKVWSQVGVQVDNAVDLRGYADCGVDNRPTFEESAPVVADVDGDGVPELIVVGNIYDCGTGTSLYHMPFILKLDRTRWSGSGFDWTVIPTPEPGSAPRSEDYTVIEQALPNAVVADLDGDGFQEILFPSYDGKVHAYWLDKTEHGSWPYTVPTTGAPGDDFRFASEPVVVDLDNDGHAEVIFTSWPKKASGGVGQLHILDYLGRELSRVDLPAPGLGSSWNGGLGAPTLAHIDGSPDLAVVVGTVASGVVAYKLPNTANARILWGTGRGSYQRAGTAPPVH
ncbi:MAG: hypothetical protein DME17_06470, partial [Candidatus Rokuibacteriota bacterium]